MLTRRNRRVLAEVYLLGRQFRNVSWDEGDYSWVHLPRLPLPPGWNQRHTELLIVLPPAYPTVPPHHFYLNKGLWSRRGVTPEHYFVREKQGNPYEKEGWAWFCMHPDEDVLAGGWGPSSDPRHGDNLLTYVQLIRAILAKEAGGHG